MTRKRVAWLAAAAFLLFAVVLPTVALPGAKAEVLRALEQGLHRNITADALHLRLLPVPGVELDGVRLSDDAAFGLEDLVIADSATANLRWLALLRGRLAFSRISLDGANINLVRNAAGEWNVQALLQTTSRTSARAAGGHALPAAERFPYLVWSNSRVNFKLGVYRTRFYLDSVEGSLARESGAWRLQLRFQPERTDLNLSNTGDVRVDGRWSTASGEPWPFDLAIRLQDSYLAGSSALFAGHDAGVHGILGAQLRVLGTAQRFEITGTASAQAVRRWDLLPPPASVRCAFRAAYSPGQDRLDLEDLGEAGWQRFRLQGTVASIFTAPRADLELALDQFRGADLLPLLEALKAHLPPDLRIGGAVSGSAHIALGGGQPLAGSGSLKLAAPTFTTATAMLGAPAAQVRWDGHRLRLLPVEAALKRSGAPAPTKLQLAAAADAAGFQVELSSTALGASDAAAVAHLAGVASPWPAGVEGKANATLALGGAWHALNRVTWTGAARWASATFHAASGPVFAVKPLDVTWSPRGAQAQFALAPAAVAEALEGTLAWSDTGPLEFALRAPKLDSTTAWAWMHAPPGGLVERVLGDVGVDAQAAWLGPALQPHGAFGTLRSEAFRWPGALEGSLTAQLGWAPAARAPVPITGTFALRRGRLHTGSGWHSFDRFSGSFSLAGAAAALDRLAWSDGTGAPMLGSGSASVDGHGRLRFDLRLAAPKRSLHLSSQ
ncbi:MAG TPA: AsmA family protein [Terriglobales bacterium]|nr:AsmA family protein [Terriglobales bacterium]